MSPRSDALAVVTGRLVDRLSGVNPSWYAARSGSEQTRSDALRGLVRDLAELGRTAGSGAPADSWPHAIGVHALADQIRVVVDDIQNAPGRTGQIADDAARRVSRCYDALWLRP